MFCLIPSHVSFYCASSCQQQILEHRRIQQLQMYRAQMATVGTVQNDQRQPVVKSQSSPATPVSPHPAVDQLRHQSLMTGRTPQRLHFNRQNKYTVQVGSIDLNSTNASQSSSSAFLLNFCPTGSYDVKLVLSPEVQLISCKENIHTPIN